MHIARHRFLKLLLASAFIACLFSLPFAEEKAPLQNHVGAGESNEATADELWPITPSVEPLDLSELLKSLGEIPYLNDALKQALPTNSTNCGENQKTVALVASDEPIVIGQDKPKPEPTKPAPSDQPSNPLRRGSDKPTKPVIASEPESTPTKQEKEPMELVVEDQSKLEKLPGSDGADELELSLETSDEISATKKPTSSETNDTPAGIHIGDAANGNSTVTTVTKSARPRPRLVEIKPITAEEQESPSLSNTPREIDAKQAREEDEKATIAKRPEANSKTFVSKPSTGRITSHGNLSANPIDTRRAQRVESCLAYYIANPESVAERSPWAVMHAMLPFGVEGEILVGNRRVNSIQWMCYNGTCRTQKLFTPAGKFFRPNVGGGVQGHEGQFLAMLAQSQVAADYPIVVGQNKYSVTDLIRYEMATCVEKSELTFKLMGLSYYVDTNQVWLTNNRNRWNIEKLVQEELAQPIVGAACGGTHRLMGLTFAVRQRQAEGRPIDGQFARADRYVKEFVEYAWKLQNPDGSFSTNWFESRGSEPNMERKVQTTGHILEWLAFTLPEAELSSPRFTKSIDFLLSQIFDQRRNKWPIGPRGHATRAIALYHQRTTGVLPGQRQTQMADQIQSQRITR